MNRIFLDNNSTTRPLREVVEAVARSSRDHFANPGSRHAAGRIARRALDDARESIAKILGARPGELIFTSGGTESINLAIAGLASGDPGIVLLTAGEHPASIEACRRLQNRGWRLQFLGVDREGRIAVEQLDDLPWEQIRLVTMILAHNETGVIQDVAPLAERCARHGIPIHLDAVQAVAKIPIDFHAFNVDALSFAAHKFHGPRGIGGLLVREGKSLTPTQVGGHQESGRRAGTEPAALAVGMSVALERWHADRDPQRKRIESLRDHFELGLATACGPIVVNGSREHRLHNTSNVAFPGLDGEALFAALDLAGIDCSMGSTCASGSAEPSPVLTAMGCPADICSSSLRFSLAFENSLEEIEEAVRRIARSVARLRTLNGGPNSRPQSRQALDAAPQRPPASNSSWTEHHLREPLYGPTGRE